MRKSIETRVRIIFSIFKEDFFKENPKVTICECVCGWLLSMAREGMTPLP